MKRTLLFAFFLFPLLGFSQAGQWVWMRGDTTFNDYGTWGLPGTESPTYDPAALYLASSWSDDSGRLWLYGGIT